MERKYHYDIALCGKVPVFSTAKAAVLQLPFNYFSLLVQKQLVFFQLCKALNYRTVSLNCRP